ncbi:MAG: response regulator [Eubacteriales bacterium]|nr:response regulator [Eubacteriales bacterium]
MLKVFLVEDEIVIRNGIKNSIPWESEGFEFVGEASDGELAYPLIKKERPDILITDIKMPFMDGLELSRIVKKELPQIKILILSGYSDFEYAKEAINIGVTQYLLKPISSIKLLEALHEVGGMIEKEREYDRMLERYQKEAEENVHLEQKKLWNDLIANRISTVELLEGGQKVGMDFTATAYLVFLFKITWGGGSTGCSQDAIALSEKIVQTAGTWEQVLTFDRSPEGWVFLIKAETEEEARVRQQACAGQLAELVKEYPDIGYFGGVGSVVHRLGDISQSYLAAGKAFAGRFFTEPNKIISSTDIVNLHRREDDRIDVQSIRSRRSERKLIDEFLRSGTLEEIDSFLEEYLLDIGEQNYQSLLYRQYLIMDLYFTASDFLSDLKIDPENLSEECRDINKIVMQADSPESIRELMGRLFTETMKLRDQNSMKRYGIVLEEARAFIRENYQREDMSLNTVASRVNISPSYFSAIFSAETGQTFVEYLTQVRLEKAKELLMCSSLRTAEIGYEVGYRDSHYFSYIFKKVVGCSPKEYKNRRKEQGA